VARDLRSLRDLASAYGPVEVGSALAQLCEGIPWSSSTHVEPTTKALLISATPPAGQRSQSPMPLAALDGVRNQPRLRTTSGTPLTHTPPRDLQASCSAIPTPNPDAEPADDIENSFDRPCHAPGRPDSSGSGGLLKDPARRVPPSSHRAKSYRCPMCVSCGIQKSFTRKADCKRHIVRDHCTDGQWSCPVTDCGLIFDFKRGYVEHAKGVHSISKPFPDKCRIEFPPQPVYACGFEGCKDKVFEAQNIRERKFLAARYADHVARHFDHGIPPRKWSRSVQIRHLLHQDGLKTQWKGSVPKDRRNQIRWEARAGCELKQKLEWCRYDVNTIVQVAISLASYVYPSLPTLPPKSEAELQQPRPASSRDLAAQDIKRVSAAECADSATMAADPSTHQDIQTRQDIGARDTPAASSRERGQDLAIPNTTYSYVSNAMNTFLFEDSPWQITDADIIEDTSVAGPWNGQAVIDPKHMSHGTSSASDLWQASSFSGDTRAYQYGSNRLGPLVQGGSHVTSQQTAGIAESNAAAEARRLLQGYPPFQGSSSWQF
jgi:hypothetical protein